MKKRILCLILSFLLMFSGCLKEKKIINGKKSTGIVYFGFMVHLEGWDNEMDQKQAFEKHSDAARLLADVFEDNGAKVTFESSPEFVMGCKAWNRNVLRELYDRGNGIGVHADKGYVPQGLNYTLDQFTLDIRQMRLSVESLLGAPVEHVSGICSSLDWAKAAIDAGYVFTTGGVAYCAQSMPADMRPEEIRDCVNPSTCHGVFPFEMKDRIHPWRVNTAAGNWLEDDPQGRLVILSSDGGIKNLYEETLDPSATHGDLEYTEEDVDQVVQRVEEAIYLSDPEKINIIYFSLSIGAADVDTVFYNAMFSALRPFSERGRLEYRTMNEMYRAYKESLD